MAAVAGGLVLMHLVLAPLLGPAQFLGTQAFGVQAEGIFQALGQELDWKRLPEQRVVVLPAPNPVVGMYVPMVMATRGMPPPRSWRVLSLSPEPHVLTRTGPASLELTLTRGSFLTSEIEMLFRGTQHPLPEGAQVKLEGMMVTVLEAEAEGPTRLGFAFDTPLEDPSLVLLNWRDGGLRRFTPPPPGERVSP